MGTITKISTQHHRKRYNLKINGSFAFSISEMTLVKFALKKGDVLDRKKISQIKKYEVFSKGLLIAFSFLSHHLRTEKEIKQKLITKGFSDAQIQKIITKLKQEKYIDDTFYAKSLVNSQANNILAGPKKIILKLKRVGVSESDIKTALKDKYGLQKQIKNASYLSQKVQKKFSKFPILIQKEKIKSKLYIKGFDYDLIKQIIEKTKFTEEKDQQIKIAKNTINKIWKRYQKYGKKHIYKVRNYLYRKGYDLDLINKLIEEKKDE